MNASACFRLQSARGVFSNFHNRCHHKRILGTFEFSQTSPLDMYTFIKQTYTKKNLVIYRNNLEGFVALKFRRF